MDQPNIGALAGKLYELLKDLEREDRVKIVGAAMVLLGDDIPRRAIPAAGLAHDEPVSRSPTFTSREDVTPKQFLYEKQPQSDIERVACIAFYLTHYRDTPHFKTIDISKLNTEAAQIKFSNAAKAVNNAATRGLITSASKGNKQISALGEEYVSALPDRDAAKSAFDRRRPRRRRTKTNNAKSAISRKSAKD